MDLAHHRGADAHVAVRAARAHRAHAVDELQLAEALPHSCYHYPSVIGHDHWGFRKGATEYKIPIRGRLQVNNSKIIADHVLAGMGIGLLPTYVVGRDIKEGRLVPLLPGYQANVNSALYVLYRPNRYVTGKVRRLIDLLIETFSDPPYWDSTEAAHETESSMPT
ncbi:LysR substrate-binding domain-containing protein [Paraburkholderia antibiotica]|uniref:LysR substrate-binding domain-containing protein n=1 Tax=Paraburkholderia antibiotica TaxID=2728839 RepID=UPI002E32E724|nr:LysR substrate-binding domain-containing protein [Paraburkholderia antibiotica]